MIGNETYLTFYILCLGKALVYGATLEAYSFIHGMLQTGISGEQIVFVQSLIDKVSCFNNAKIETIIHNALIEQGTEISTILCLFHVYIQFI